MIAEWMPTPGDAYYSFEWIVRIVMLIVVPWRRSPAATRSWLLLIFFLPLPGLLLYLAIGRPAFPKWRRDRLRELAPRIGALVARLVGDAETDRTAALACKLGGMPRVAGNAMALIDDYDAAIAALIDDIDCARHHVRILVYIFATDETGRRVIAALGRAVARGVSCHVLVDPVGSHRWIRGTLKELREAGVTVQETLPFHLLRGRTRRDMRNHRKLFLIDGEIGYAGSQNLVDKNFRPNVVNRELVARVTGPAVSEMAAVFLSDWYLETRILLDEAIAVPAATGDAIAQVLPSGAAYPMEGFQTLLVAEAHAASSHIVITSPYFIPDEALLGALRTAVFRGVAVDLIVSAVADQPLVNLAQHSYYDELLSAGIRIHRFRRQLLHAKNVSIDGRLAILGSSNVDIRSFELNEEVSLLLFDSSSVHAIEAVQRGYLENSDRLERTAWRARAWYQKFAENAARLVSPLL